MMKSRPRLQASPLITRLKNENILPIMWPDLCNKLKVIFIIHRLPLNSFVNCMLAISLDQQKLTFFDTNSPSPVTPTQNIT